MTASKSASSSENDVSIRQRRSGSRDRSSRQTVTPSPSGSRTSRTATSGRTAGTRASASAAVEASPTTVRSGSPSSSSATPRRTISWSSSRNTRIVAVTRPSSSSGRRSGGGPPGVGAKLGGDPGGPLPHRGPVAEVALGRTHRPDDRPLGEAELPPVDLAGTDAVIAAGQPDQLGDVDRLLVQLRRIPCGSARDQVHLAGGQRLGVPRRQLAGELQPPTHVDG